MSTPSGQIEALGSDFADAAALRLRDAQAAMTDLLAGAGLEAARPTDVGRRLGLDKTLAWKVSRFVREADPVEAARHMPGAGGVEIVLRAAAALGVAGARVDAVRDADRRLRAFVDRHAGDRRSFEAMLAAGGTDEKLLQEERRAFYRAGAAIWGVRARVQFLFLALRPSGRDDGMLDGVQLGGLVDFERLRPDVPWIVRRLRASATDDFRDTVRMRREPLDPAGAEGGCAGLVPEYCSRPPPVLRQFEDANGWVYDEIGPGTVGRGGAVTCVTGEIYRSALPYRRTPENSQGRYVLTVRTPVEVVLFDLLLHRSLAHFGRARASVAGLLEARPAGAGSAALLAPEQEAQRLGSPAVMQTARLASYPAMASGALARAGWGGLDEFVGYRMELEFPPAPCELAMTCEIGEGGEGVGGVGRRGAVLVEVAVRPRVVALLRPPAAGEDASGIVGGRGRGLLGLSLPGRGLEAV